MSSKKLLVYILILALIAIVVFMTGKKKGWFGDPLTVKVAVEKGKKRNIIELITANGKVQPETEVKISPEVSGEIVELNVKEGDYVQKGKLLIKIKPDNYISARNGAEAALNNMKARLKQSESQLILTQLEFERMKKLWQQKAISEAEYDKASSSYSSALAEKEATEFSVKSSEASLREAEENLRKTSVYAPMSGTLSMLSVELGERVLGTNLMTGTEMLRIADLSSMEVEVEVNENDIVKVHQGDTALIEVDAYLGRKFKGIVTEIPVSAKSTGQATDQVTNFNVKVRLLNDDYKDLRKENNPYPFRPGMSATADIQTFRKSDVFSIPLQAVTTRPDTAQEVKDSAFIKAQQQDETSTKKDELIVAFVAKDGKSLMKQVTTGIQDDRYIEVSSGLDELEEVIIGPYSAISKKLKNNTSVEIVPFDELFKTEGKK